MIHFPRIFREGEMYPSELYNVIGTDESIDVLVMTTLTARLRQDGKIVIDAPNRTKPYFKIDTKGIEGITINFTPGLALKVQELVE